MLFVYVSPSLSAIPSLFVFTLLNPLRSMAPAARKLKGGLRRVFKRNPAGGSGGAARFTLSDDEDNSDDEAEHSTPATVPPQDPPPDNQAHDTPSDSHGSVSVSDPERQGGFSPDSQIENLVVSGIFDVPENNLEAVGPVLPSKHHSMSEPMPFTCHDSESSNGPDQEEHTQMTCEQTEEIQPTCQKVVVPSNPFNDTLPRELQLAVLKALVGIHEEEHQRAERGESHDQMWSVRVAGKTQWIGRDKGLRELVKLSRVGIFVHVLLLS
jgi:hypothetical protein